MSKNALIFFFAMLSGASTAQTYLKIYDDPSDVLKGHVGVELYGVDVGFGNITGAMLFVTGINGSYTLNDRLGVEASLRAPLVRFEKQGASFIVDGGAMLKLGATTTDKDVNVVLSYSETDIGDGYRRKTVKYVPINGSVTRTVLLRGGVYLKNTAIEHKEGTTEYAPTNLFHKGIYLGIGKQRQYFFQLQQDRNGKKTIFGAGSIFRPYVDVMILPTVVNLKQETFGLGEGVSKELKGFVGMRAGFRWYRNPFTKAQNEGRRIPFFGNAVVTLEAGSRPLEGFFFNGAITYILKKF